MKNILKKIVIPSIIGLSLAARISLGLLAVKAPSPWTFDGELQLRGSNPPTTYEEFFHPVPGFHYKFLRTIDFFDRKKEISYHDVSTGFDFNPICDDPKKAERGKLYFEIIKSRRTGEYAEKFARFLDSIYENPLVKKLDFLRFT